MSDEDTTASPSRAQERVRELTARLKEATSRVSELESQLGGSAALLEKANSRAESWKAKHTEAVSSLEERATRWGQERALIESGYTDADTQEIALLRWGKLGDGRPELGEWLTSEDGASVDPIIAALRATAAPAPKTKPTTTETGVVPAPPPAADNSDARYRELQQQFIAERDRGKRKDLARQMQELIS